MKHYEIKQSITDRSDLSVKLYLKDIAKYRLLTPEEEKELSVKSVNGDQQARNKLIESNLRFVVSLAKQYQNKGVDLSDLISVGNLGLIKAAEKFDPTKEFRFLSYAGWWIRDYIINEIINNGKAIRIPFNKSITINKINNVINSFEIQNERTPTPEEVAELLALEENDVKELMEINSVSIVKEFDDIDTSYNPEINCNTDYLKQFLHSHLTEIECDVLIHSFGLGELQLELKEIAEKYNLTRERVRQIKNTAILKLRKHPNINNILKIF